MKLIEIADLYFVYVTAQLGESSIQSAEANQILLHMSRGGHRKMVFPIVFPGAEEAFYRSPLASFQAIMLNDNSEFSQRDLDAAVRRVAARLAARQNYPAPTN